MDTIDNNYICQNKDWDPSYLALFGKDFDDFTDLWHSNGKLDIYSPIVQDISMDYLMQ